MRRSWIAALLVLACGEPPPAAEPPEPAPSSAKPPVAAVERDAEAPAQPQAPEPEPELPVSPDGVRALPCAAVPPATACIPGGPFVRGSDDGPDNARPRATVWVQTFYMDTHEVTYAQYKACQKAGDCPRAGPRYTDFDHPDMPIQGITWFDALKYCQVQGKRLPTEAQWEKAARGPDGKLYPWGDDPVTCEHAIIRDAKGRSCGLKKAISKPETGRPWDVGSRPVGVYGLFDMVGNSWEWVHDWYSRSYAACGEVCQGTDPRGPCGGADKCSGYSRKIVRGGSWYWDATRATGIYRRSHTPANDPFHHFGFRCAATAQDAEAIATSGSAAP